VTSFSDRLAAAVRRHGNPVVVGLDPRCEQLPAALRPADASLAQQAASYQRFCAEIIDVVAGRVPAVKPQMAFFEQLGPPGMGALAQVIQHARRAGLLVILDGKRNDIGSTAAAYAAAYLGTGSAWEADALTVSPYLGDDSLTPFVQAARERAAGLFVLVKTSNPGGRTFQDLSVGGAEPLYRRVAGLVEQLASATVATCGFGDVGAVVGATYPEQLDELRQAMPHSWFLVPGYGAQGAGAAEVQAAFDSHGLGAVINSSRAIIFAHQRPEYAGWGEAAWQRAVEAATEAMIGELRDLPQLKSLARAVSPDDAD
jgi:orotidine-5'-phosphate decarboxylase